MKSCGPFNASTAAACEIERRVRRRLRLHLGDLLDQRGRAAGIADTPAGHAIGFADAVHGQGAVIELRLDLRRRREFEAVIDQVLVHVVGHHPDMRMLHQHVGQRLQLGARIGGTGRVRRRVQDDPLGFRRDRLLEILRAQLEAAVLAAGTQTGLPSHSSTMSGYETQYGAGMITSSPAFSVAASALYSTCLPPVPTVICSGL
jgi:hypothetical protein